MTISIIYRVELKVPEGVAEHFRDTQEFEEAVLAITQQANNAGQYGPPGESYIWAQTPMLSVASRIDKALHALLSLYQLRVTRLAKEPEHAT